MTNSTNRHRALVVNSSGRGRESVSRMLSSDLIDALRTKYGEIDVVERDLGAGVALVDETWIEANFTAVEERSASQRARLLESDALVNEMKAADIIVVGMPIYNFSIPAALKAWVDMIARARLTFRYTDNGPEGLLTGKKAFLIVASGGVPVDSPVDFATPYMRHALRFVGIDDIEVVAAEQLNSKAEDSIDAARSRIAEIVHLRDDARARVA